MAGALSIARLYKRFVGGRDSPAGTHDGQEDVMPQGWPNEGVPRLNQLRFAPEDDAMRFTLGGYSPEARGAGLFHLPRSQRLALCRGLVSGPLPVFSTNMCTTGSRGLCRYMYIYMADVVKWSTVY